MAKTLEQLRSESITNVHGRRLGLDVNGFIVGAKPVRNVCMAGTGGDILPNSGNHTVTSSTAGAFTLAAPVAGCAVTLTAVSASTNVVTFTGATCFSTNGVASADVTFNALGESVTLNGISTSEWVCSANNSAAVFSS